MKFYYENNMGDEGIFTEKDIIKAIYTSWNIEGSLYLVNKDVKKLDKNNIFKQSKLIFAPYEGNDFNSDLLKEFGYYIIDEDEEREIRKIKTNKIVKYDWSEVKQLI